MSPLHSLKRFAQARLEQLELCLPVLNWEEVEDSVKMNAIHSPNEWRIDSPLVQLEGRRDRVHWFACDPSTGNYIELFFERFEQRVAVVWAQLKVEGRRLILREALYADKSDGHTYCAGGVRLECTAPMRRWRLAINALMEAADEPNDRSGIHVRLGARATAVGHTLELPKQCRASFLARQFLNEKSPEAARNNIADSCGSCQVILQPSTVYAEVALDGQRHELLLFGSRMKNFSSSQFLQNVQIHVGYAENGTTFTAIETGGKAYGYCCNPVDFVQPIRKGRWGEIKSRDESMYLQESLSMLVGNETHKFWFDSLYTVSTRVLNSSRTDSWSVGKVEGTLSVRKKSYKMQSTVLMPQQTYQFPEEKFKLCQLLRCPNMPGSHLVLSTSDVECRNSKVAGGKGSSLAILTLLSEEFKSFTVPTAVVLTVDAYKLFAEVPEVRNAIEKFLQDSSEADLLQMRRASDMCVSIISNSILPEVVRSELADKLFKSFGEEWETKKFAVRSSAVGEDSEEMSAAGQMTTYLGIKGKGEIFTAVCKCWASQFASTAVTYKRQYGQELNSAMAVVVQEMVNADCAGVMFTCDPVTSDPSGISISANFGLGESVVSATADPDTYSLSRREDKVILVSKKCGAKNRKIVESKYGRGTEEEVIPMDKAQTFCLTDELAVEIASLGAILSDVTNSPRDIEWATVEKKIYLLQSRHVTSFLRESDFEIRHDTNSGLYTNREILSRANLDEVMPGAFSPLGKSIVEEGIMESFCKAKMSKFPSMILDKSQFGFAGAFYCGKKTYINLSRNPLMRQKSFVKALSMSIYGYDISEHEALKNGIQLDARTSRDWKFTKFMIGVCRELKQKVKEVQTKADQFKIDFPKGADSLALFMSLRDQFPKLVYVMDSFTLCNVCSTVFNVATLNVLKSSQAEKNYTPEIMIQLSKLIRSDYESESALIPKQLARLSNLLRDDPEAALFVQMTPEEALDWLENANSMAGEEFRTLRAKHAHRCYKEFDIYSETWDMSPILLVQSLQANVKGGEQVIQRKLDNEDFMTVDQLPKQPSWMKKKLLHYLIGKTQLAVYAREAAKSSLMKCVHQIRLSVRKIAQKLVAEGRLPEPGLMYFLTCDEVYRLITTRDPSLLPRAIRRRRMHPLLDEERLPVLLYGMPKPIDSLSPTIGTHAKSMSGTPVSGGLVVGPARVIHNFLTEAHLIKKGEILVTRATDTGWTPYFPLLGGVVTEVGGLLSHGAVVAREYGLPAVVGMHGVTGFVNVGDIVTLDGDNGVLHKSTAEGNQQELHNDLASPSRALC